MNLPDWIERHDGERPVIVFAPHGGRRLAERRPGRDKVNDLYTAELARELAQRWSAAAIINPSRDRNEIDLNRISAVRRHADWLPTCLAQTVTGMVEAHGHATLLVMHGWNVVQAVCDVGMGVVDRDGECVARGTAGCTGSAAFIAEKIRPLQREAEARGLIVAIGARYPAAHPNNLMQLFTATYRDDTDPSIRTLARFAADGMLDAVQLELGIPLRWPGRSRTLFTSALTRIFAPWAEDAAPPLDADLHDRSPRPSPPPATHASGGDAASPGAETAAGATFRTRGLQFVAGDLLGFTSIDARGSTITAGRLLLSPGEHQLALFTGELAAGEGDAWTLPRLRYEDEPDGCWRVRYDGPLLGFPMLTPFLDLEHGLANGDLVEANVDLQFRPSARVDGETRRFGSLAGTVVLDEARYDIATGAIAHDGAPRPPRAYPSLRLTLPRDHDGVELLSVDGSHRDRQGNDVNVGFATTGTFTFRMAGPHGTDAEGQVAATCVLTMTADAGRVRLTVTEARGDTVTGCVEHEGTCERLIPVRRPGRHPGTVVHSIYALVRFPDRPPGWLELAIEDSGTAEA